MRLRLIRNVLLALALVLALATTVQSYRSPLPSRAALRALPTQVFRSKPSLGRPQLQRFFQPPSVEVRRLAPASSTRLYFIGRFMRVVAANINSLLKRLEDPEKIIEQAVADMQTDLTRVRQSFAEVTATLKRFERQRDEAASEAESWQRRAQTAMQKGDEGLAREALSSRNAQRGLVASLEQQIAVQRQASAKLFNSMGALEAKIAEAKRQKESLIARARTAKTALQVNDMLSALTTTSSSVEAFARMKDKVDSLETQADVAGELAGVADVSLEERFKALDADDALDAELQQMRRELATPAPVAPFALPADLDAEYEQLKRKLRSL